MELRPERAIQNSIPQISFVVTGAVFFQNAQIFVLECFVFVPFFLIENVFPDRLEMRWADTEESIAVLSVKNVGTPSVLMNLDESFLRISTTLAVGNFFVRLQRT